jgi:hypothetical protein
MRFLTIFAILAATSSILFLSTYSVAQEGTIVETSTESEAPTTEESLVALVSKLMADDPTLTEDAAIELAVISLISTQPNSADTITKVAFEIFPESAQTIFDASVSTGKVSEADALNLALVTGIDSGDVSGPTAAGGTGDASGTGQTTDTGETTDTGLTAGTGGTGTVVAPVGGGAGAGGAGGGGSTVSTN